MNGMTRAEAWHWVQALLPMSHKRHFETGYEQFLRSLPERPMQATELARLAYFAGAAAAFAGLANHEKAAALMSDADALRDLQELALEPLEYLRRYGMSFD